jgi:hypothetical protein
MSIHRRLERLEKDLGECEPPHEWPVEDQMDRLLHTLRLHRLGRSVYEATDRELELLDVLIHEGISRGHPRSLARALHEDGPRKAAGEGAVAARRLAKGQAGPGAVPAAPSVARRAWPE